MTAPPSGGSAFPLSLRLDQLACMLNAELPEHPVYDGIELQRFDDSRHGTGMLAFLTRRDDGSVDYYQQRGLRLDRSGYQLGGGTRSWTEIDFETARLIVADDGVDAEARFRDGDGRDVHVRVHDREGGASRRGGLLAPVGAGIENPSSLLLVWMPRFDLVRRTRDAPVIRIGGVDAQIGHLPGAGIHRRHLIKYAAPVLALRVNPVPAEPAPAAQQIREGGLLTGISTEAAGHEARIVFAPGLTDPAPGAPARSGRWHVEIDGTRLTGGSWVTIGTASGARMRMEVDERWRPGRLPWLMRLVTTVIPVFRRWPTTYRWRCDIEMGEAQGVVSRWQRTANGGGNSYVRATRGRSRRGGSAPAG